ncbi:hypothetical protein H6P81_013226 [Aristolochia fimbriata]|uniref:Uncharacterized protein n=1 Tax=Aristolochia fimbriata TaxID=158543 RepID=A0AAV7EE52_ARIFI|nr:hypothetical protein H6P81_013226 [Aristolochia fimbriata]
MGVEGFVDWRGKPVDKARHGGHRAASFMYFMQAMTSVANVPNLLALVTYLHSVMHMAIDTTSTTMTNFFGATCAFALLGGFLSDSYITRFKTILIFGPLEILGYGLLALQARLPSLRPQPCVTGKPNCTPVQGLDSVLLYASLYTIALGEGGLRANLASFGGDQYDDEDPVESRQKSSFFNWFTFSLSIGAFLGLILIVWVEDNTGWPAGFALSAFFILVGLSVVVCGFPLYRNQCPGGSPLTRMLQVFVAAFKKRKLPPPEDETELHHDQVKVDKLGGEILPHTNSFRFLDKAAICHGNYTDSWSLCTVTQVEETKIVLRMVPIFISTCFNYIPIPLLLTLTVQQGGTMNTNLGNLRISPATLLIIPVTFQTVILVAYDRVFLPLARKLTGYKTGITHLQRIGIGFVASFIATSVAGAIERKRKSVAEEKGLVESSAGLPMSMFWLGLQFFFLGIIDASTFVGLLEFFNTEFSRGMKSLATAVFWCILGLSSFMGSVVVNVANDATKGHERGGWLEGNNLNRDHLDRFYWLLSVIGFLGFLNYLYWAKRYVYRQNLLIEDSG